MQNARAYERKIAARQYISPGRARAAVARSELGAITKRRLNEKINEWEASLPPVVAGLLPSGNGADPPMESSLGICEGEASPPVEVDGRGVEVEATDYFCRLNVNARVRVRLTLHGMALVHRLQSKLSPAPEHLVEDQGVWETELWNLARVLSESTTGDEPILRGVIDVLDPRGPDSIYPRTHPAGSNISGSREMPRFRTISEPAS